MKKKNELRLRVTQGFIRVSRGTPYIYRKGAGVVAIYIDLIEKYANVSATGSDENNVPSVALEATRETMGLDKKLLKNKNSLTEIEFPDYAGWSVFTAHVSKYTLAVCLTKD